MKFFHQLRMFLFDRIVIVMNQQSVFFLFAYLTVNFKIVFKSGNNLLKSLFIH